MILEHLASEATCPDPSPSANGLSRRGFLQAGAATGGGLLLSLSLPFAGGKAQAAGTFAPNAFIRIGGDGQMVLTMPYVEMGQGTYTAIPMLIAEELDVDLSQVRVEHAPPNEKLYGNPLLGGIQATGNSNAIRASWKPLRQAGATARTMLISAAAKRWNVDPASCHAQSGEVLHELTGQRAKYGELAADAHIPIPESVVLKTPKDFKLIGTPAKRVDTPAKVNGTAVYGIDVRLPGMKVATLEQSPVFGGHVTSVDDTAAKAVKSVRQIIRLDDAVAVVADHMGAAKKGLAALVIKWDDGPHAKLNMNDIVGELEQATLGSGAVAQNIGDTDKALASATIKIEAIYQVPFLAHATMEPMNCTVHFRKDGCEILGRQPGDGTGSGDGRESRRPAGGEGHRPQSPDRRRLRQAAGGRRCGPCRRDCEACRWSREGRLDARGGYPARHVSAILVRSIVCRSRRERDAGRLEPSFRGLLGYGEMGPSNVQERS